MVFIIFHPKGMENYKLLIYLNIKEENIIFELIGTWAHYNLTGPIGPVKSS